MDPPPDAARSLRGWRARMGAPRGGDTGWGQVLWVLRAGLRDIKVVRGALWFRGWRGKGFRGLLLGIFFLSMRNSFCVFFFLLGRLLPLLFC